MDSLTIISLGGSVIVPDAPSVEFVKAFTALIKERVEKGRRFIIVTGGGKTARDYQKALAEIRDIRNDENDWMGIFATHLNAQFLRLALGELAHPEICISYQRKSDFIKPVLVAAGAEPGHSTDYDAILLAKMFDAKNVVNVSNIDYVYTADPRKDPNAKALPKLSWSEYLALIPKEWAPGFSSPFDVEASKLAADYGIGVSIVNGAKLEEVAKAIDGESFDGTVIS